MGGQLGEQFAEALQFVAGFGAASRLLGSQFRGGLRGGDRVALLAMLGQVFVGEQQRGPRPLQVPLDVIRQKAYEHVGSDTTIEPVKDGTHQ